MAAPPFFSGDGRPLSRPEAQWKAKPAAYETAQSWFAARDVPPAIRAALDTDPVYADARLVKAIFERQTVLDEFARAPSHTNVLAILETRSGLAALGVEGKAHEPFGQAVQEWNDFAPAKLRRLAGLIERSPPAALIPTPGYAGSNAVGQRAQGLGIPRECARHTHTAISGLGCGTAGVRCLLLRVSFKPGAIN